MPAVDDDTLATAIVSFYEIHNVRSLICGYFLQMNVLPWKSDLIHIVE